MVYIKTESEGEHLATVQFMTAMATKIPLSGGE
jgi:hypothetical protein